MVVNGPLAEPFRNTLEGHDIISGTGGRSEVELHGSSFFRRLDALNLVECFDATLHLRRFRSMRGEPVDEPLLLGQFGLLARVRRLLIRLSQLALAHIELV